MASVDGGATQLTGSITQGTTTANAKTPSSSQAYSEEVLYYIFNNESSVDGYTGAVAGSINVILSSTYNNNDAADYGATMLLLNNPQVPPLTGGGGGGITTYFKMRGFYVAGAVYEVFVVTGAPSSTPPSGHTLINVAVVSTWQI